MNRDKNIPRSVKRRRDGIHESRPWLHQIWNLSTIGDVSYNHIEKQVKCASLMSNLQSTDSISVQSFSRVKNPELRRIVKTNRNSLYVVRKGLITPIIVEWVIDAERIILYTYLPRKSQLSSMCILTNHFLLITSRMNCKKQLKEADLS